MAVIPEGSKRKGSVEDEVPRSSKRQATLQGKAVSPAAIRGLVAQFIVNDMLPLSTVESPSFRKPTFTFCAVTRQKITVIMLGENL